MSSLDAERLYALLPAVYRIRDEQQGRPLRALVGLIAREFEQLEENIEQLYDDQFIETCADWVAPYIGDLIGYRPLHGVAPAIASPRAEVANTIGYRRRKGTAAMLEQLARDVTDWPARAAEFFEQLATTQYMNHVRLHAPATACVRSAALMRQRGGPFNRVAHTAEMRRAEAGAGRYNIPNIGIFLWRLQPFRLSDIPLTPDAADPGGRKFRFNPLGADQPLFRLPLRERQISHIAEPANVPDPIDLRLMARAVRAARTDATVAADYGQGDSILLARPDPDPARPPQPIDLAGVCVCDLRDSAGGWAHEAELAAGKIAIDPRLGRVLLGSAVAGTILATFHSGFSRAIGAGEYERSPAGEALVAQRGAAGGELLQPHLDLLSGGGRLLIGDSRTYAETPLVKLDGVSAPGVAGRELVLAARNGARPLLAAGGPVTLDIGARGRLVLDGLVIAGGALHLPPGADEEPRELVLRDCTLVPGLALNPDGSAGTPGAPSLVIDHPFAQVTLERCISGPLRAVAGAAVVVHDSIVDAGDALAAAFDAAGAELSVTDSTVIGKVDTGLLRLASNSIFTGVVTAERRQAGCVRFCWLPAASLTPRRYRCLPDAAHPAVLPHFTSLRYADPAYCQLRRSTDKTIREGADDGAEMGVLHSLFQPQRETNLRLRLEEYLRFGLHAGIFYAT